MPATQELTPKKTCTPRPMVRSLGFAGVILAGGFMLAGCGVMGQKYHHTKSMMIDHIAGAALSIESQNGSITAIAHERSNVSVIVDLYGHDEGRLEEASVHWERGADQTLSLWVQWPGDRRRSGEGASWDVELPDATGAQIKSSNGSITIEGFSGHLDLKSSNGRIQVRNLDGSFLADTSNGSIQAEHISGEAEMYSSNGKIIITDAFGPIRAETSNGKVYISTMDGNEGPIRVRTSNGRVDLDLGEGFVGKLTCRTGNGSVSVHDIQGAQLIEASKKRVELQFGDSDVVSAIKTSNGSVYIQNRLPSILDESSRP